MNFEKKNHILESGDFSVVTIAEAIEWIEDMKNSNNSSRLIGCYGIQCADCCMGKLLRPHEFFTLEVCSVSIEKTLSDKLKDTGYGKGMKFGL